MSRLANLLAAADDLARLLERRGLQHPKHATSIVPSRKRIKAVMVHFFERQRKAALKAVKPRIARQLMLYPHESAFRPTTGFEVTLADDLGVFIRESPQGKTFARNLLPVSLQPLSFAATRGEQSEYNDAITTLIGAAAQSLDASAAVGEDFAGEYLAQNSLSKLTGELNRTSVERLQDALADAWDKGGDYDSMVKAVTDTFDDFSTTRAELIAQTEANDAYSEGRHQGALNLGMDEKRWDLDGEACQECEANADADWVPIDEDFPSGDDKPTAHPGCDCGCDYRKGYEDDDEDNA